MKVDHLITMPYACDISQDGPNQFDNQLRKPAGAVTAMSQNFTFLENIQTNKHIHFPLQYNRAKNRASHLRIHPRQ